MTAMTVISLKRYSLEINKLNITKL